MTANVGRRHRRHRQGTSSAGDGDGEGGGGIFGTVKNLIGEQPEDTMAELGEHGTDVLQDDRHDDLRRRGDDLSPATPTSPADSTSASQPLDAEPPDDVPAQRASGS